MTSENDPRSQSASGKAQVGTDEISIYDRAIAEAKALWAKNKKNRTIYLLIAVTALVFLMLHYAIPSFNMHVGFQIALWILFAFFGLAALGVETERHRIEAERLETTRNRIQYLMSGRDEAESYFDSLVKINVENLGEYYALVKSNTRQSFQLSATMGIVGFAFIIAALVIGLKNPSEMHISYVSAGAGVIVEVITGIFFFLYNRTVRQLKEYHDSLLDVQNILLSFRLIEKVTDTTSQSDMINKMIEFLVGRTAPNQ